jgi:hypothetical protein
MTGPGARTPRTGIAFGVGLAAALSAGWLGLPAVLYERLEQPAAFSHAAHTGEAAGMACDDCHGFDADGRFQGIPPVAKCRECHETAIGETAAERDVVERFIAPDREIPWHVYSRQPDNAWFPHAPHVKRAALPCERCHGDHGSTAGLRPFERNRITGYSRDIWGPNMTRLGRAPHEGMKMDDCAGCHRELGVVDSCQPCHR